MAGLSLRCGDCGAQLRSVEEAQAHAEVTNHANFVESTEAVLNLVCSVCSKPCLSETVRSSPHPPTIPLLISPIKFGGLSIQYPIHLDRVLNPISIVCGLVLADSGRYV